MINVNLVSHSLTHSITIEMVLFFLAISGEDESLAVAQASSLLNSFTSSLALKILTDWIGLKLTYTMISISNNLLLLTICDCKFAIEKY